MFLYFSTVCRESVETQSGTVGRSTVASTERSSASHEIQFASSGLEPQERDSEEGNLLESYLVDVAASVRVR